MGCHHPSISKYARSVMLLLALLLKLALCAEYHVLKGVVGSQNIFCHHLGLSLLHRKLHFAQYICLVIGTLLTKIQLIK